MCRIVFQLRLTPDFNHSTRVLNYSMSGIRFGSLCVDAEAHLNSYEGGSEVEAGVLGVGNPLLIHLHQLPDALQQFAFIKQLQGEKDEDMSC